MKRLRAGHKARNRRRSKKALLVFLLLLVLIIIIDSQLRPLLRSMTSAYANQISTKAINDVVVEMMEQQENDSQLVHVQLNGSGKVNSIETDMSEINRIKAQTATNILNSFGESHTKEIWVPIGTLMDNDLVRGRGPKLLLLVELLGNVNTEIYSCLEEAGINQTIHKIMLRVTTSVYAVVPGCHTTTDVKTEFCIAETVIVGEVPESYVNLSGDYSDSVTDFVK